MADTSGWSKKDWYRDGETQLHFFPGSRLLLWLKGKTIVGKIEAWGGEKPAKHVHYRPGTRPGLTTPGTYVIYAIGPYVSPTNKWVNSKIAWGTPLIVSPHGDRILYKTGLTWAPIDHLIPGLDRATVQEMFNVFYGSDPKYDSNRDGVPDTWIFNDFGPISIRYFTDSNRNRKLDAGERKMGEMIHTTPQDEHATDLGQDPRLQRSHGCIHVKPGGRDFFSSLGAFKVGQLMVTHGEREAVPSFLHE